MAYTTIDDPSAFFQTKLYTGTGSSLALTNDGNSDLQPDWVWVKRRDGTYSHALFDSSRGSTKRLVSNLTNAEDTNAQYITSFNSDGFTAGTDANINQSSLSYVAWQWKAGGSTPTKTYKVVVVSDGGNKYRFRNSGDTATFAQSAVTLDLQEGGTYTFDLSDSSVDGHPLKFSETSNGSHGGGSVYSTGVVYQLDGSSVSESNYYNTSNFNSASSRKIIITVASSAPTLYYYCHYHSGMGGQVNTNTTHGQTNFDGDILSVSQANTTAGFSIVTYTGTGSATTVGHGLGVKPNFYFLKNRDSSSAWDFFITDTINSSQNDVLSLNTTSASVNSGVTLPTTSVFSITTGVNNNQSGNDYVAYCFSEIKGYSKFGSYTGNGSSSDGTFIYTGFKPAWFLAKRINSSSHWTMLDGTRNSFNVAENYLHANETNAENTNNQKADFLSNGIKLRSSSRHNDSGSTFIYMAFGHPFVSSKGVPVTAR